MCMSGKGHRTMKKRNDKDSCSGMGFLLSGETLLGVFGTMMIVRPMLYQTAGMIDRTYETSAGNAVVSVGV